MVFRRVQVQHQSFLKGVLNSRVFCNLDKALRCFYGISIHISCDESTPYSHFLPKNPRVQKHIHGKQK